MAANGPPNECTPAELDAATGHASPLLGAGALKAPPATWPGHCSTALATSDCSNQLGTTRGALTSPPLAAPTSDAGARPQNRTLDRGPIPVKHAAALDAADLGCGAQASIAVADESSPTGRIELLPFLLCSSSAVELCRGIADGSATSIPVMHVSEALAILVYRLVFDRGTRAKELSVRVLVARRLHHPRVAFPRPARHQRLRGG